MHAEQIANQKNILLITGESTSSLRVGLEQEGCEVTVSESSQKAWGFVYPIRPDLIILHLPQLSDKDIYALQECLALADGVPVIVATAASRTEAFTKEIRWVLPRFLSLPLKPNALREALHGLESEWDKQFSAGFVSFSCGRPVPFMRKKEKGVEEETHDERKSKGSQNKNFVDRRESGHPAF